MFAAIGLRVWSSGTAVTFSEMPTDNIRIVSMSDTPILGLQSARTGISRFLPTA